MLQFIPNNYNFKLDLTYLNVTFNETNSMFDKEFNNEFSFPFSMSIDFWEKHTNLHYNAKDKITQFEGKLDRDGKIVDATLKINTKKGNVVEGILFAGLESFPNFDKPLKDLALEQFDVVDLVAHAETIIVQDYPAVNYNFPMIHTDKYDETTEEFNGFQKIFNNYSAGAYVSNIIEPDTNIDVIRNILQPVPYLMYLLKKGFEEIGYTLAGDILTDNDILTALPFREAGYFNSVTKESIPIRIKNEDHIGVDHVLNFIEHVKFENEYIVPKKGDYILFGDIVFVVYVNLGLVRSDIEIHISKISGGIETSIYDLSSSGAPGGLPQNPKRKSRHIDIPVSLEAGDTIKIVKIEPRRDQQPESITKDYPDAAYLDIVPIRYRNPDGSPIISLLMYNKIDLKLCVPDMTFGELVQQIRIIKNLDFIPAGNVVTMDYIKLADRSSALPFDETEVEEPLMTFHDDRSYEILFVDGKTNKDYPYDSLFVDKIGVKTNTYTKNKNTTQILIDALPYPVIDRGGIRTAFAFDDETSKLRLVFFKAADQGESPLCFDNPNMLIPKIYTNHYINWIYFLIHSTEYEWDFIISVEKMKDYTIRSLIYAYSNFHLFTEIEKERIVIATNHYYQITARSESLV